ncbi:MAG: hypothetical protein ACTSYS_02030, partial [Promethearchaeota archaeon]
TYAAGLFDLVFPASSLAIGTYNINIIIETNANYYENSSLATTIWINRHDTQAFGALNQSSVPVGQDVEITIHAVDIVSDENLTESNVTRIIVTAGVITQIFVFSNWSHVAGEFHVIFSASGLNVNTYSVQITIITNSSFYDNASTSLQLWIIQHSVLAGIVPVAPIPYGDDSIVEITLTDLVLNSPVGAGNIISVSLAINGSVYMYDAINGTFTNGLIQVTLPTSNHGIGNHTIDASIVLNGALYYNASDSLPVVIRPRMIEWIVFPILGTPVGFTTNISFRLIDLDDPNFSYINTANIEWANTTDNMVINNGSADSATWWVEIDTSNETAYPIGASPTFTLQVFGTGIDTSKTKNITINIVQYNIVTRFESIPTKVGYNQTSETPFSFWIDPDDFGKIWMAEQDAATIGNIHIEVSAGWINDSISIPSSLINNTISINATLQTLGFYIIQLVAPPQLDANETFDYQIEFTINASYNRSGTFLPIFKNVTIVKNMTITKVSSSNMLGRVDESGNELGNVLPVINPSSNLTFYVDYLPGSNVTFSVKGESGYIEGYINVSMVEVSSGKYQGIISKIPAGAYDIEIVADPGADSNYEPARMTLILSVQTPTPWMMITMIAAIAAVAAIAGYRAVSYLKTPKLVRIIDATINTIERNRKIKNAKIVRSLNDILSEEIGKEWDILGLQPPPFRPKTKDKMGPDKSIIYKKGIKK